MPGPHPDRQVAIQARHRDTGMAVRSAFQVGDKAGSVLARAASPCRAKRGQGKVRRTHEGEAPDQAENFYPSPSAWLSQPRQPEGRRL